MGEDRKTGGEHGMCVHCVAQTVVAGKPPQPVYIPGFMK